MENEKKLSRVRVWLQDNRLKIFAVVALLVYFFLNRFYFMNNGGDLVRCSRVSGECIAIKIEGRGYFNSLK
jgi:hypothetical protein